MFIFFQCEDHPPPLSREGCCLEETGVACRLVGGCLQGSSRGGVGQDEEDLMAELGYLAQMVRSGARRRAGAWWPRARY
jgi:hypothetical protein